MACNPISERQVFVFTSDGRLSLVEIDVINNNNASLVQHGIKPHKNHLIARPNFCLEDMIPGKLLPVGFPPAGQNSVLTITSFKIGKVKFALYL